MENEAQELTADQQVDAWLAAKNIKFIARGGYPSKDAAGWEHDRWEVIFSRPQVADILETYRSGIANRKLTKMGERAINAAGKMSDIYRRRLIAEHSKPVPPTAASVLYCFLSDISSAEQNFHDWCSDFGADSDSIKALNTYNACCEMLTKMRAFFSREERAELEKLLEDY